MPPFSDYDDPEDEVVVGRRSSRLSVILPITIRGIDAAGQAFKENTWTIGVNKHGAKLATFHQLLQGEQIAIENPVLGRSAKARVVRIGEKRFPEDPFEIGVELLDAQNIWGVRYPPEDWQKGRPLVPSARVAEKAAEPAPPQVTPKPVVPPLPKVSESLKPKVEAAAPPTEPGAGPEKFNQFKAALAALSQYAKQAEETTEARARVTEEKLAKPAGPVDAQLVASLLEAVSRLEEKEKTVRSLEERLGVVVDRLQTTRGQIEDLLAKVQTAQEVWESDVSKSQRQIREAAWQSLRTAIEEIDQRVRKHAEAASANSAEETRKRLHEEISSAVEALSREAGARLASLSEEYLSKTISELQARRSEVAEEAKAQAEGVIRSAAAELGEKLRNMAGELVPSLRQGMEKSLGELTERTINQLTDSFQGKVQAASRAAEATLERDLQAIQERMREEITGAGGKARELCRQEALGATQVIAEGARDAVGSINLAAEEARTRLRTAYEERESSAKAWAEEYRRQMEELSASALEGIRRHKDAETEAFRAELRKVLGELQETGTREALGRLQRISEDLLESSAKQLHEQAEDGALMLSDEVKTEARKVVEETRAELGSLIQATLASFRKEVEGNAEQYRSLFRKTLQEFQAVSTRELEVQLPTVLEKQREAIRKMFESEAEDFSNRVASRIKSKSDQAVTDAVDTVYKQVGEAVLLLKDWADKAKERLDSYFQRVAEAFQKQTAELSATALERHRQAAEELAGELQTRLQQVSRHIREKSTEPSEPRRSSDDPLETPSRRFRKETEEALESVIERLKERHQQALDDATETFRSRLSQTFANFPLANKKSSAQEP